MNNKLLFLISLSLLFVLGSVGFASAKTNPNFTSDNKTEIRKFFMREYLTHNNAFDVLVEMPDTLKDLEFIDEEDSDKVPFFESSGARNYRVEAGERIENSDKEGYGIYKFHCDFFGGKRLCTVKQDQEALAATRRLVRKINKGSDYQKIKKLFDWIYANVDGIYGYGDFKPLDFSAYSAIIKKRTKCGVDLLFDQACEIMNIKCRVGMRSVNSDYDKLKGKTYIYIQLYNKWYLMTPLAPDSVWEKRDMDFNAYEDAFLIGTESWEKSTYDFSPIYGFEEFHNSLKIQEKDYATFVPVQICITKKAISKKQLREFYNKIPLHLYWIEKGAKRNISEYKVKPKRKGYMFAGWRYYSSHKRARFVIGDDDGQKSVIEAIWKKKKRKKKSKYRIKVTVNSKKANYKNKKLKPPILGALILINTLEQVL